MLRGRSPEYVSRLLAGSPGPVRTLGAFPTARYLQTATGEVFALLSSDAVALPIGIVLDRPSRELQLDEPETLCAIRDGRLYLDGCAVPITGRRETAVSYAGEPLHGNLALCRRLLSATAAPGDPEPAAQLSADGVACLLGNGPGLTPAGDDVLCGLLAGARLFGRDAAVLIGAVRENLATRPRATTALSRQLLLSACAGHGLPQLQRLAGELCGGGPDGVRSAWAATTAIGHSSGAALAAGLIGSIDLPRNAAPATSPGNGFAGRDAAVRAAHADSELAGSRS